MFHCTDFHVHSINEGLRQILIRKWTSKPCRFLNLIYRFFPCEIVLPIIPFTSRLVIILQRIAMVIIEYHLIILMYSEYVTIKPSYTCISGKNAFATLKNHPLCISYILWYVTLITFMFAYVLLYWNICFIVSSF